MARANLNSRTVVAPLAAFTMACLLFVYTRSSIQTAKVNAKLSRISQQRAAIQATEGQNENGGKKQDR